MSISQRACIILLLSPISITCAQKGEIDTLCFFDQTASLRMCDLEVLDACSKSIASEGEVKRIHIASGSDHVGFNILLSNRRLESAKLYLLAIGVDSNLLHGNGELLSTSGIFFSLDESNYSVVCSNK